MDETKGSDFWGSGGVRIAEIRLKESATRCVQACREEVSSSAFGGLQRTYPEPWFVNSSLVRSDLKSFDVT